MQVHGTSWLFRSIRPTISGSVKPCKKMSTIEMDFTAYPAMPRTVCSEVLKKTIIVLSMRRYNFDGGPHLPRHFRSSLTRVTDGSDRIRVLAGSKTLP